MAIALKEDFLKRMKDLLKDDYDKFLDEYNREPYKALRVNTLKISAEEFQSLSPFSLLSVPWCKTGFYYSDGDRPGSHIYHDLGLYYIQEPSAMAVVEALCPEPGDRVLDMSAAPGGKATHIAAKLNGKGILVANEINGKRVKTLVENIERMGIKNAVITNESPAKLISNFYEYFDKVLVDAPCSGEGMFRKDEDSRMEWSENNVLSCSIRQKNILESAAQVLKPGGILVYSTCTFAPEENEGVIKDFLSKNKGFVVVESELKTFFDRGYPEWVNGSEELKKCMRLWPHKIKGEGHFIAKLKKSGEYNEDEKIIKEKSKFAGDIKLFYEFADKYLNINLNDLNLKLYGNFVYHVPEGLPDLNGIKVYRYGWQLGELKKNRFEPSHWLAMAIKKEEAVLKIGLKNEYINKYLHGETFATDIKDGWAIISIDGFPIGWGKVAGGILKNYYPKPLRK